MLNFIKRIFRRKARIVSVNVTEDALYAVMSDGRVMVRSKSHASMDWFEHAGFKELSGE